MNRPKLHPSRDETLVRYAEVRRIADAAGLSLPVVLGCADQSPETVAVRHACYRSLKAMGASTRNIAFMFGRHRTAITNALKGRHRPQLEPQNFRPGNSASPQ